MDYIQDIKVVPGIERALLNAFVQFKESVYCYLNFLTLT